MMPSREDRAAPEMKDPSTAMRQGVMLGTMRWVLGISLVLAVVAFSLVYYLR